VRGEQVDPRADIFSIGVVLYELLSGRKPFKGDSVAALIYQVLQHDPQRLEELDASLPHELTTIVARALAKDTAARYQTVDEMLADLQRVKGSLGSTEILSAPVLDAAEDDLTTVRPKSATPAARPKSATPAPRLMTQQKTPAPPAMERIPQQERFRRRRDRIGYWSARRALGSQPLRCDRHPAAVRGFRCARADLQRRPATGRHPVCGAERRQHRDIAFSLGSLHAVNGAIGMKVNAVGQLLVTFNMLFRVNEAGLRTRGTPLIGMEYGF
jgi:hypothetical protein